MVPINVMGEWKEDKKLITDLGWEHTGAFWFNWPVKENIRLEEFSGRPVDFRLNFVAPDRYITIESYERNSFDWETVYCGAYISEEHLIYLMKTFNILQYD